MLKNPNWNPAETEKTFGKSPCTDCPHYDDCDGFDEDCESFALAEEKALDRIAQAALTDLDYWDD